MFTVSTASAGVLLTTVCVALLSGQVSHSADPLGEYYYQQDYSETLTELESISVYELSNAFIGSCDVLVEDLTQKEIRFLSRYYVDDIRIMCCEMTFLSTVRFGKLTGKIPANGIELQSLYHPDLLTDEGLVEFCRLPTREQLMQIALSINPATGQLYTTFTDEEWHAFGVYISKLENEEAMQEFPLPPTEREPGEGYKTEPRQGFRLVLFGENPGTVLVDKIIWTKIGSPDQLGNGRCGCKPAAPVENSTD